MVMAVFQVNTAICELVPVQKRLLAITARQEIRVLNAWSLMMSAHSATVAVELVSEASSSSYIGPSAGGRYWIPPASSPFATGMSLAERQGLFAVGILV